MYIQFISNIIRNNNNNNNTTNDKIEDLFKTNDKYASFCRGLMNLIKESENVNLIMNSMVILIKLRYENLFTVLWPASSSSTANGNSSTVNKKTTNQLTFCIKDMFSTIDMALHLNGNDMITNSFCYKFNALNFLNEMVKCKVVRQALEK